MAAQDLDLENNSLFEGASLKAPLIRLKENFNVKKYYEIGFGDYWLFRIAGFVITDETRFSTWNGEMWRFQLIIGRNQSYNDITRLNHTMSSGNPDYPEKGQK